MPFYEYECKDCGGSFELMQSIKADPVEVCELCPGTNVRRKFFPAGIIFKGSGFYSTEYRSSGYAQQQQKESESSDSPKSSTSSSKTDSKSTSDTSASSPKSEESPSSKKDSGTESVN